VATRKASQKALDWLKAEVPALVGGSADLTPSNLTNAVGDVAFSRENPAGRLFHFGVREHAMAATLNGMALHGGILPYGGTFLIFSDYLRPALRLSALMNLPVVYVFTHDSIFLGEDGPTHQPVAALAALRAIPRLTVIRPADAVETVLAWEIALERKGPVALCLTRQEVPVLDWEGLGAKGDLRRGGYISSTALASGAPAFATGSGCTSPEAARRVNAEGAGSWQRCLPGLFAEQDDAYRRSVLAPSIPNRLAVAASPFGWERFVG
jgi:transketolase